MDDEDFIMQILDDDDDDGSKTHTICIESIQYFKVCDPLFLI